MMATTPSTSASQQPQQEGRRATALRTVLNRSLEKTIQTCSYVRPVFCPCFRASSVLVDCSCYGMRREVNCRYDKVAVSFPLLAEKAPEQLKFALDQALGFLKSQVQVWISISCGIGDVLKYRS
jgi:hypothetical protein